MKKIMFALVAIVATCVVNAASVTWALSGATADNGKYVYGFTGSAYEAVVAALDAGGADVASTIEGLTGGSAKINRGKASAGIALGSDTKAFWVMFDGAIADGTTYAISALTDVSANTYEPPASGTAFGITGAMLSSTGTIGGGDVPEPTSGLLLFIGGAMLALRRRRA